jgi:hypothetical protein
MSLGVIIKASLADIMQFMDPVVYHTVAFLGMKSKGDSGRGKTVRVAGHVKHWGICWEVDGKKVGLISSSSLFEA